MESLDVVKYIGLGDIQSPVFCMVRAFPFQKAKEALASCIVTAMTHGAH
tara:strand:- start:248 stop:394 length:147 start_codon:yes stop_codon:yes gene_type:complete